MAATPEQRAALRARLQEKPPASGHFSQVHIDGRVMYMPWTAEEIAERKKEEAAALAEQEERLANPQKTLEDRLAAIEAKLGIK